MNRVVFCLLLTIWLVLPAFGQPRLIELEQLPDVALEHQRMPGNARAQAERRGVIRSAPQLFVYHPDGKHTPAFYMQGIRRGFQRHLDLMLRDFREQRSMVPLSRLLENARESDGSMLTVEDLPVRRVVMVVYDAPDCASCDRLDELLEEWLDPHDRLDPVLIRIALP